jgi:hypothetical protein
VSKSTMYFEEFGRYTGKERRVRLLSDCNDVKMLNVRRELIPNN